MFTKLHAGSTGEVDQLVSDFMGDDAAVRALVAKFLQARASVDAEGSGLSSSTAHADAGPSAGQEVSGPAGAAGTKGSGLSSTAGRTLVDMRAQQVHFPALRLMLRLQTIRSCLGSGSGSGSGSPALQVTGLLALYSQSFSHFRRGSDNLRHTATVRGWSLGVGAHC